MLIKPHHLKDLPPARGQHRSTVVRNVKCDTWQEAYRPSDWLGLDDKESGLAEDVFLEFEDKKVVERKSRLAYVHDECPLTLVARRGTEATCKQLRVGRRRAQQILNQEIERRIKQSPHVDLFGGVAA